MSCSAMSATLTVYGSAMRDRALVFHLAALIGIPYSYRAAQSYVRTNIEGTLNVLQAARDIATERVVCTSTSEVYGTRATCRSTKSIHYKVSRHTPPAKSAQTKSRSRITSPSDYPFRSFGPLIPTVRVNPRVRDPDHHHASAVQFRSSCRSAIPTRDFNYVTDTVEGFLSAASESQAIGKTINFGSGVETTIGDLAKLIGRLLGKDLTLVSEEQRVRPENSEVDRLCADSSLAQQLLGWRSRVSLKDGLRQTIAWMEDNLGNYRVKEYAM